MLEVSHAEALEGSRRFGAEVFERFLRVLEGSRLGAEVLPQRLSKVLEGLARRFSKVLINIIVSYRLWCPRSESKAPTTASEHPMKIK